MVIAEADKEHTPGNTRYRFRKENRLPNPAAFTRVFEKPVRSRDRWFTVLCRENHTATARLGLAVSKKHCRHATARNRLKRIVRESFRQHQADLAGLDVVVVNQPAAANGSNRLLFDSLSQHWQKCARNQRRKYGRERNDG